MGDVAVRPVVMVVLDGWGIGEKTSNNAIYVANPPNFNRLFETYPNVLMKSYGRDVGLPEDQMGGSEVGHLSLGAGRVVYQELSSINDKISKGEFQNNSVILEAMKKVKDKGTSLHIMGLLSDGGVHSHVNHLYVIMEMAKKIGLSKVYVHAFLDGRDVPPRSALLYVDALKGKMNEIGVGRIATLSGRYYAMDRDNRWERIKLAWDAIVNSKGQTTRNIAQTMANVYDDGVTDEFFLPTVVLDDENKPVASVKDGDCVIFFNYRADRARELMRAFNDKEVSSFIADRIPEVNFVCMSRYSNSLDVPVAFEIGMVSQTLGEVISEAGYNQLRVAETEKFAHVTYFFNGGAELPFLNESRVFIPSLKITTYDLHPEMGAYEIKGAVVDGIRSGRYTFILANFANSDMVGHTGKITPTIEAVLNVDECLGDIEQACRETNSTLIVTADHGNADEMIDPLTNKVSTSHSFAPVPFIICQKGLKLKDAGSFKDVAPTILDLLNVDVPETMTGESLIIHRNNI